MSKCRPDCCSRSSEGAPGIALIGFIALAAVYGVFRAIVHAVEAIMHIVIEIVEITAITVGSIAALALLTIIAVRIIRWHHARARQAGLNVTAINFARPPITALGKKALDSAELFAEAVASPDMDPRFIEVILRNAMERPRP